MKDPLHRNFHEAALTRTRPPVHQFSPSNQSKRTLPGLEKAFGSAAESAQRILTSAVSKSEEGRRFALQCAKLIGSGIESDRYDFYFMDQKALVYEMDEAKLIGVFYKGVKEATAAASDAKFDSAKDLFGVATALLKTYIAFRKLNYVPHPHPIETAYELGKTPPAASAEPGIQSPS